MIFSTTDTKIIDLLSKGTTLKQLTETTGLTPSGLMQRINYIKNIGYLVEKKFEEKGMKYYLSKQFPTNTNQEIINIDVKHCFKFIAISDTHLTRTNSDIEKLRQLYKYAEKRKIPYIFHSGDLIEGMDIKDNQNLSKFEHVIDQVNYLTAAYPKEEGVTTMFILGNHDMKSIKQEGIDISKAVENRRLDMHFLGYKSTIIKVNNRKIALYHPFDYDNDKNMEKCSDMETDIILRGHYHQKSITNMDNKMIIDVPQTYDTASKIAGAYEIILSSSDNSDNLDLVNIQPLIFTSEKVDSYMEITEQFTNNPGYDYGKNKYENMSATEKFNQKLKNKVNTK